MRICKICIARAKAEVPDNLLYATCGVCGQAPVLCGEFSPNFNFDTANWNKDEKKENILSPLETVNTVSTQVQEETGRGFYLWLERGHPQDQSTSA